MNANSGLQKLRRQRNAAGVFAVFILLVGFMLAAMKSVPRYRTLRAAQGELVDLQARITDAQNRIRQDQGRILELQRQILALQKK